MFVLTRHAVSVISVIGNHADGNGSCGKADETADQHIPDFAVTRFFFESFAVLWNLDQLRVNTFDLINLGSEGAEKSCIKRRADDPVKAEITRNDTGSKGTGFIQVIVIEPVG